MEKNTWRTIAIIFICLFSVLLLFNIWAVNNYLEEENNTNECYYDVCSGYIDAWYSNNICFCYETDML